MTSTGNGARVVRRTGQVWNLLREGGVRELAQRASRYAYNATGAGSLEFPLASDEICEPPSHWPEVEQVPSSRRLVIGWVCSPPSAGSGGHTTMFRMVEALESAGHTCIIYLHERYGTPISFHERTIRSAWPGVRALIRGTDDEMSVCDAMVATSWQSAHVLGVRTQNIRLTRFYFIQDYEPYFEPRGAAYALAESTYGFGFHNIALGQMVGSLIPPFGRHSTIEFSCDTDTYRLENTGRRSGVVCYVRMATQRRGTELALLALEEFHRLHPDQPIHLFGDPVPNPRFPAIHHGRIHPKDLASLYNECTAGIGLSFTNISLVVEEMLACGTVPVVNDSALARLDTDSSSIVWADPTPRSLAGALSSIVSTEVSNRPRRAAESVRFDNWSTPQKDFVQIVESHVYARHGARGTDE